MDCFVWTMISTHGRINHLTNTKSRVAPTEYAIARGAYPSDKYQTEDGRPAGWWWLRSPGFNQHNAAFIFDEGSPYYSDVDNGFFIVRPAFWLDLASGVL